MLACVLGALVSSLPSDMAPSEESLPSPAAAGGASGKGVHAISAWSNTWQFMEPYTPSAIQ